MIPSSPTSSDSSARVHSLCCWSEPGIESSDPWATEDVKSEVVDVKRSPHANGCSSQDAVAMAVLYGDTPGSRTCRHTAQVVILLRCTPAAIPLPFFFLEKYFLPGSRKEEGGKMPGTVQLPE